MACELAARALDSMYRATYHDSLAVVCYFVSTHAPGDTLSPPEAFTRRDYYGIPEDSLVVVMFDGQTRVKTEGGHGALYQQVIANRKNRRTPLALTLDSSSVTSDSVKTTLVVAAADSVTSTDLRAFFVVIQDSLPYGVMDALNFVGRRIVPPDTMGIRLPVDSLSAPGETLRVRFATSNSWGTTRLGFVSFVQDYATKEIVQAVIKR